MGAGEAVSMSLSTKNNVSQARPGIGLLFSPFLIHRQVDQWPEIARRYVGQGRHRETYQEL